MNPSLSDSPDYKVVPLKDFKFKTLQESADSLGIHAQRLSRMLRILQVPVRRLGNTILLDSEALARIQEAISSNEIKPGRKPQTGRA